MHTVIRLLLRLQVIYKDPGRRVETNLDGAGNLRNKVVGYSDRPVIMGLKEIYYTKMAGRSHGSRKTELGKPTKLGRQYIRHLVNLALLMFTRIDMSLEGVKVVRDFRLQGLRADCMLFCLENF